MIRPKITDPEEDVLERANGGFGLDFGWGGDDFGEGFEDGGAGGDDVGTGGGGVPVLFVLVEEKKEMGLVLGLLGCCAGGERGKGLG
jgi:hypothetical protein